VLVKTRGYYIKSIIFVGFSIKNHPATGKLPPYLPIVFPTWHPRRGDSARAGPPVDSTRQRRPVPGAGALKHWRSPRRWTSEGWRSRAWTNPRAPGFRWFPGLRFSLSENHEDYKLPKWDGSPGISTWWHQDWTDPGESIGFIWIQAGLIHWILSWKERHRRFFWGWYMVLSYS